MGTELSRGQLFDPILVTDLLSKVKGYSSLAKLSAQKPIPFNGNKIFTFTMDTDIDIVAENGKKTHGGVTLEPKKMMPIKIEYGARVSDEFMYASEEARIDILKSFNEGFAKKLARGLDIMAFHGFNPRTKQASSVIGSNHFDATVTQKVVKTANPDADIETAVNLVQGSEGIVTGIAMDTAFSTTLAKVTNGENGPKMYPELAWGGNPDTINGLKSDVNTTVSFTTEDLVVLGDFENMFKWGYAKDVQLEVIEYGDPDNSGKDLKGYNQIYLRAEAFLGWAIMDENSFARITKS
ncbi:phage major capsid protein [Carnobacteriaceae bacterium zg-ZUI240]|nr:phage major capsid protein [Carnobacteriaceae bacterium zg-ZUI240]